MAETGKPPGHWLALGSPSSGSAWGCRIESVGVKLPARRLTTRDLMSRTSHRTRIQLERLTGIHERHVVGPGENSFTLATGAARDCLAHSQHQAPGHRDADQHQHHPVQGPVLAVLRAPAQPVRQAGDRRRAGGELRSLQRVRRHADRGVHPPGPHHPGRDQLRHGGVRRVHLPPELERGAADPLPVQQAARLTHARRRGGRRDRGTRAQGRSASTSSASPPSPSTAGCASPSPAPWARAPRCTPSPGRCRRWRSRTWRRWWPR